VTVKRLIPILLISALAAGCSPMFDVSADFDPDANFSSYRTYDLMESSETGLSSRAAEKFADRHEVMVAELTTSINEYMQAKGFSWDSEDPDILVAYYVGVRDEIFASDFGLDYNDITGAAAIQQVQDGSIRIDFVDPRLKKVVWTAVGFGAVNRDPTAEMIRKNINRAVKKLLDQYPPKKPKY
jgi:hypothetical protein